MLILSKTAIASQIAGCDPTAKAALEAAALQGIGRANHIVHQTHQRPASIFDLSCLDQYLNGLNGLNFLFDPSKLFNNFLEGIKNQICDHAEKMWARQSRKLEGLNAEQLFADIPGIEAHSRPYELGKKAVKAKVESPSSKVDIVLPKVLGKEVTPFSLKELIR